MMVIRKASQHQFSIKPYPLRVSMNSLLIIFDGEWEEVVGRKTKVGTRKKANTQIRRRQVEIMNEEQAADINQNSFDELMVGDEEQLASTCKTRLRNNKKIDNDYNGEEPDSQDEWADMTSSEGDEEDTSEESSDEEGNKQGKGEMSINIKQKDIDGANQRTGNQARAYSNENQTSRMGRKENTNPDVKKQKGKSQKPPKFNFHD